MSLSKEDVWAELRVALELLENPPQQTRDRLADSVRDAIKTLYEDKESDAKFFQLLSLQHAHSKTLMRNEAANAHEAIEKGLKAILIDSGLSVEQVKKHRHHLDKLLMAVQQHNPTAFNEIERCFESTMQYLESVTSQTYVATYRTQIIDYFQRHGKEEVFVENRYESIEGKRGTSGGMIGFVYREIIRALMSLTFGNTPKDICSRIEEEARRTVLAESRHDPAWDAEEWFTERPVRPRLGDISNLENNRVLHAAVRRCARESEDSGTRYWAQGLRQRLIVARRKARAGQG